MFIFIYISTLRTNQHRPLTPHSHTCHKTFYIPSHDKKYEQKTKQHVTDVTVQIIERAKSKHNANHINGKILNRINAVNNKDFEVSTISDHCFIGLEISIVVKRIEFSFDWY